MTTPLRKGLLVGAAGLSLAGSVAACAPTAQGSTPQKTSTFSGPYKDGTYSADGDYISPNGGETVGVELTLAGSTISAVDGDFVLPPDAGKPVLLIAAGIGIAPFLSQLASGGSAQRDIVVLYLAPSAAELAGSDVLAASGARVIARLSDGSPPPSFMHDAGRSRIDGDSLRELIPDVAGRDVYVCGSPANVDTLRSAARHAGARRIHVGAFAGY